METLENIVRSAVNPNNAKAAAFPPPSMRDAMAALGAERIVGPGLRHLYSAVIVREYALAGYFAHDACFTLGSDQGSWALLHEIGAHTDDEKRDYMQYLQQNLPAAAKKEWESFSKAYMENSDKLHEDEFDIHRLKPAMDLLLFGRQCLSFMEIENVLCETRRAWHVLCGYRTEQWVGRDLAAPVLQSAGVGDCVVRVPILSSPEGQMSVKDQTTALVKLLAAAGQST